LLTDFIFRYNGQYTNHNMTYGLTLQRGVTSTACHSKNATCRGMTSTARHSKNATCRGVTSTARHAALSHSFDYISTTKGENVNGLLCTCSRRIWLSYGVGDSSYILLLHFFLSSRSLGFFLQSLISQPALCVSGTRK